MTATSAESRMKKPADAARAPLGELRSRRRETGEFQDALDDLLHRNGPVRPAWPDGSRGNSAFEALCLFNGGSDEFGGNGIDGPRRSRPLGFPACTTGVERSNSRPSALFIRTSDLISPQAKVAKNIRSDPNPAEVGERAAERGTFTPDKARRGSGKKTEPRVDPDQGRKLGECPCGTQGRFTRKLRGHKLSAGGIFTINRQF